jgi:ferritin-like metal-binding protein YciE
MMQQAKDRSLSDGFRRHREVTRNQIRRLEECFESMGERPSREHCAGAEGLVGEYQSFVRKERPDAETLDTFAAGSALKVEHYEIAAYATMIDLALRLGMNSCATQLEKNLREEEATAAELEMASRKLGAELTGSSAGLRGAIETLRAGSRSGGVTAVGRAVASQAGGALNRLEQRGRRARTTARKRATRAKTTVRRKTAAAKRKATGTGRKATTGRRTTTGRTTTGRTTTGRRTSTARRKTTARSTAARRTTTGRRTTAARGRTTTARRKASTRPASRARRATRGPATRARSAAKRPVSRAKRTVRRTTARRTTRARSSR